MNHPEVMEAPRAEPDFEAQDEMSEWAVANAERLAQLWPPPETTMPPQEVASVQSGDSVN